MREEELRDKLQGALGEPPALRSPALRPPANTVAARGHAAAMAIVATLLAIILVVVLVGTRLALRPQAGVVPGTQAPTPGLTPAPPADSFPCALPVTVTTEPSGPGPITQTGAFVNLPGGDLRVDPSATISDLPAGSYAAPAAYSAALKRWLPIVPQYASPDATEYAYATHDSGSSQLHVVDAATRADRVVWTSAADVEMLEWSDSGIIATAVPFAGGVQVLWHVDPSTGATSKLPTSADPTRVPFGLLPGARSFALLGLDAHGRAVFRIGSRDAGASYSVVIIQGAKLVATVYSGKQGDGKDFDPAGVYFDAHGLWFGNFGAGRLWLWTDTSGLRSFPVTGLPAAPAGDRSAFVSVGPAGPCVPGAFTGVAASPIAAPPAPSPTPVVDWSPLLARPLVLPSVPAGTACPASRQKQLDVHDQNGKNGPDYGYGGGPAYLTGQLTWYSSGSQGVVVLVDPSYKGPVLVRAERIDGGNGTVTVTALGQDLGGGATGIAQLAPAPYWGVVYGGITFSAPGCYGVQFDGGGFSDYAVISVVKGPPPPG